MCLNECRLTRLTALQNCCHITGKKYPFFERKTLPTWSTRNGYRSYLREVRYAPPRLGSPMGVAIFDTGKVGFFSSKKESFKFLVESQECCLLMQMLFESLWKDSKAVSY